MSVLEQVITLQEAAQTWGVDDSTLRHAIKNNRFENYEIKKSSNTWLILKSGMSRLYGKENQFISLLTIGYEGYTVESFIDKLKENKIDIVVDVREIPLSHKKGFSKTALSENMKLNNIKYCHFKEFGSPKEIRTKLYNDHNYNVFFTKYKKYIKTQTETLDIITTAISENREKRFCLLCFEKNPQICHRSVLAEEISKLVEDDIKITNI